MEIPDRAACLEVAAPIQMDMDQTPQGLDMACTPNISPIEFAKCISEQLDALRSRLPDGLTSFNVVSDIALSARDTCLSIPLATALWVRKGCPPPSLLGKGQENIMPSVQNEIGGFPPCIDIPAGPLESKPLNLVCGETQGEGSEGGRQFRYVSRTRGGLRLGPGSNTITRIGDGWFHVAMMRKAATKKERDADDLLAKSEEGQAKVPKLTHDSHSEQEKTLQTCSMPGPPMCSTSGVLQWPSEAFQPPASQPGKECRQSVEDVAVNVVDELLSSANVSPSNHTTTNTNWTGDRVTACRRELSQCNNLPPHAALS